MEWTERSLHDTCLQTVSCASTQALFGLLLQIQQRIAHKCCEDAASRQYLASQEC